MRFTAIIATAFFLGTAFAAPAPNADAEAEAAELIKRGHGCSVLSSDDGVCNFHCKNEVTYTCPSGKKIKPSSGKCGGPLRARCDCVYSTGC